MQHGESGAPVDNGKKPKGRDVYEPANLWMGRFGRCKLQMDVLTAEETEILKEAAATAKNKRAAETLCCCKLLKEDRVGSTGCVESLWTCYP